MSLILYLLRDEKQTESRALLTEVSLLCFKDGLTALHQAADGGHWESLKLLLESGCDVNAQTDVRLPHILLREET